MASDRIIKYHEDIQQLISKNNVNKLNSEILKLKSFLQKHQNELITDGSKQKLLNIIEITHSYSKSSDNNNEELVNTLYSLMSDYLALPEGKLVGSKMKRKVLSLYDNYTGNLSPDNIDNNNNNWIVADISNNSELTLMSSDCSSDEILENITTINNELYRKILNHFNDDSQIRVILSNNKIIKAYLSDNTEL